MPCHSADPIMYAVPLIFNENLSLSINILQIAIFIMPSQTTLLTVISQCCLTSNNSDGL